MIDVFCISEVEHIAAPDGEADGELQKQWF